VPKKSAAIYYGGKRHYLGLFGTKQEAALAYDREARQCGEDKALNCESTAAAEAAAATAAQIQEEAVSAVAATPQGGRRAQGEQ
jgi:hypothetical protein